MIKKIQFILSVFIIYQCWKIALVENISLRLSWNILHCNICPKHKHKLGNTCNIVRLGYILLYFTRICFFHISHTSFKDSDSSPDPQADLLVVGLVDLASHFWKYIVSTNDKSELQWTLLLMTLLECYNFYRMNWSNTNNVLFNLRALIHTHFSLIILYTVF